MDPIQIDIKKKRILIVEDEAMILMMLEDVIEILGFDVAGSASTVKDAISLIDGGTEIDAALLDVNLGGERVYPVAEKLALNRTPFAFCTGYGNSGNEKDFPNAPVIGKPYDMNTIRSTLNQLLAAPAQALPGIL